MQRGFTAPFILLGILIIGGLVGYLFFNKLTQQINLETPKKISLDQSQKTYTNKNLGFEFEYPNKELTVREDSGEEFNKRGKGDFRKNFKNYVGYEPGKLIEAVAVLGKENSFDKNPFTVWIFDNPNSLDIDSWYKSYWYYPFVWGDFTYTGKFALAPKQEATISGQMGKSGIIDYQPGKPEFIYLSSEGKMYLFRIINEQDNIGDQILATFKLSQ